MTCALQPICEFVHIACDGTRTPATAWGGRIRTVEAEGHPYSISTTTLRADASTVEPKHGDAIEYQGVIWQVKQTTWTKSLCRVIIHACRAALINCPAFEACLWEQKEQFGCDAGEDGRKVASPIRVLLQVIDKSERTEDQRIQWTQRYRVYVDPAWAQHVNYQSWFQVGTEYFKTENLIDFGRMCRVPYVEAVKECPPWL